MSKSARDITNIHREIDNFRRRISALQEQVDHNGGASSTTMSTLIEELHVAAAELLANEEEFWMKQEQWGEVQERLRQERQYYEDLFNDAPDAYLVTTAPGIIQHANLSACALLQSPKESLIGKPLLVFVDETHKKRYLDYLERLKSPVEKMFKNWELKLRPPKGSSLSASVNVMAQRDPRQKVVTLRWSLRELPVPSQTVLFPKRRLPPHSY